MAHENLSQVLSALGVAVSLLIFWRLSKIGRRPKNYPPGPPTLPLIGNLHQVYVVLSADYTIKDLLDKRGPIYASRPDLYIAQHIISGGLRVLFMEAGETWKMLRKLGHRIMKLETVRTYVSYQELESKAMLLGMLEDPSNFIDHLRRYTASLTTQMTFGFRTTSIQDPKFKEAFDIFDTISELTTAKTAAILDFFPILRRLPDFLVPVKRRGRETHRRELKLFRDYYLNTKQKLKDGTAKPCVCVDLVQMQKEEGLSDDLAAYTSGSLLQAGSETTSGVLVGFVQAMIISPEVAQKGQEEIDRVCGDRLPDLNDVPDLPYIRACMKESLRWMQGFPLGVPHATTQDDEYMGFRIPKNATIILNSSAIHTDPTRYPSSRTFNPLRFWNDALNSADSATSPDVSKRDHFVFGAGRRRCLGMHITDRSLFLAIARLLWAFDFRRGVDPVTGKEIVPDMDALTEGMFVMPKPFPAVIRPRDLHKALRVRKEWERMGELLDEGGQWKVVPEGLIWRDYEPGG